MLNIEDLESEIEYLRIQLVSTYMKQGSFNSPVVLGVSQQLDVLLNYYDSLKSGNIALNLIKISYC
ncbi:aspartyl-phosphate phosphatase Spo0E family protein [Paenibacillus sp. WQ 127069]|uniref:Aspartyl-phosphate phosphatase Spo0E family protein n=1 Tax=Paenibacillus baimaensis TaxID=2982185 RepID=A0ABT2UCN9_9BACL|nr:aspartyl-phosphate phosphatase Spo0E family protein [Paenibacillus sp. WQ 127069]MCU6792394.1 aspartyl-phosphate phosphatase Spo0E family protein [Paenibacillus sp. WQ 127069]